MRLRGFSIILLLLAQWSYGQTNQDARSTPDPSAGMDDPELQEVPPAYNPIQFSVFVWPSNSIMLSGSELAGIPRLFYSAPDGGNRKIALSRNGNSPLYTYIGPQPLELYDVGYDEIPPPEDAEPGTPPRFDEKRIPRIRVEVPEEFRRVLLILIPGQKNPDGTLLTIALPYNTETVRPGMARIYNSTDRDLVLQFKVDDEPLLKINSNKHVDFTPASLFDGNYVRVFGYSSDANGAPRRVHVSKMLVDQEQTNFFILYPQGRRVRMLRLGSHGDEGPEAVPTPPVRPPISPLPGQNRTRSGESGTSY